MIINLPLYVCRCDNCGLEGPPAETRSHAWLEAESVGFSTRAADGNHYCGDRRCRSIADAQARRLQRKRALLLAEEG